MSEQSNAFIQLNDDESAYVTTAQGTEYVSNEMSIALEKVMCEVVNFAQYIQSLDQEITQPEAYHILATVISILPVKLENDQDFKVQLLNMIQEFKNVDQKK